MAIGTLYRLSNVGIAEGALHVNTFWMRQRTDDPVLPPSQALVQDWRNIMDQTYRGCLPSHYEQREFNVFVSRGSPENLSVVNVAPGRGVFGGGPLPTQLSSVITWRTPIAGRRFRGRAYFGALTSGCISGQQLTTQYFFALDIFATRLRTVWNTDSHFDFVVFSKANLTSSIITDHDIRTGVFTQRRRTAAYGE